MKNKNNNILNVKLLIKKYKWGNNIKKKEIIIIKLKIIKNLYKVIIKYYFM